MTATVPEPADTGARCPFCQAPWTQAMLDQYDAMTDPHGCSCCGPAGHAHTHEHPLLPAANICCERCGRAIYRALTTS